METLKKLWSLYSSLYGWQLLTIAFLSGAHIGIKLGEKE